MSSEPLPSTSRNRFLTAPVGRLFAANALPMMVVMMMNGLLNVVDAIYLGKFVGADALTAVSIVFPLLMLTFAFATLVGGGMASLYSRRLGAGQHTTAAAVFAGAHGLSLALAAGCIVAYFVAGPAVIGSLSGGDEKIMDMAAAYLSIMVLATPIQFILAVHADAARNEGRSGTIALISVGVTMANIVFNYLLIVVLEMGVAGSALGSAIAQITGLVMAVAVRLRSRDLIPLNTLRHARWTAEWRAIATLGAPMSLSFTGIALISAIVITTLRLTATENFDAIVAAYGIVTRIMGFAFPPMMAIALATQATVGNNFGAGLFGRSNALLRIGILSALAYCVSVEVTLLSASSVIGGGFVDDAQVIGLVGTIIRPMVSLFIFAGPTLVLAMYYQSIGRPARTGLLTLIKPFILSPLCVAVAGILLGAEGMWKAFPLVDALVAVIAALIVFSDLKARTEGGAFGATVPVKTGGAA